MYLRMTVRTIIDSWNYAKVYSIEWSNTCNPTYIRGILELSDEYKHSLGRWFG